ncbi:MAG: ArnT family glycosyltransferase [Neisseriaceae bacterium]
MDATKFLKQYYIQLLIVITILFNAFGLFFPILRNDDPVLYATIAKHIILTGNWIDLTHPINTDWLDKPHFPFWITALSFKLFGITSFAYALPGFLFNLIGAFYTFRLGKYLFNRHVGYLSALIYLSSFHLMLSATIDIRAEAYLMGTIIPACYYWLIYFNNVNVFSRTLLLGSIFTACAIMSKGIFVLVTISSGIIAVLIYTYIYEINTKDQLGKNNYFCRLLTKIVLAICLTLILIIPELITLYLQFDAHPEKVIYGRTHVSGIKWFFWDSQIGRFFNDGQITRNNVSSVGHYFFFIHTFLWAFLPWSVVFIFSLWYYKNNKVNHPQHGMPLGKIFLLTSFFATFIMFSLTKFQLDYYTNIIMPFASIICASSFYTLLNKKSIRHPIFHFQIYMAFILCLLVIILSFYTFTGFLFILSFVLGSLILLLFIFLSRYQTVFKAISYPVIAINFVFFFILLVYGSIYANFDAGYKIAQYINHRKHPLKSVVDFRLNSLTLEFYSNTPYMPISDLNQLDKIKKPFYIVTTISYATLLQSYLKTQVRVVKYFSGTTIDKVMQNIFNKDNIDNELEYYVVLYVK